MKKIKKPAHTWNHLDLACELAWCPPGKSTYTSRLYEGQAAGKGHWCGYVRIPSLPLLTTEDRNRIEIVTGITISYHDNGPRKGDPAGDTQTIGWDAGSLYGLRMGLREETEEAKQLAIAQTERLAAALRHHLDAAGKQEEVTGHVDH